MANHRKIVISGYYGFGNSGDEAVLYSIVQALQNQAEISDTDIEPIILSIDPEWTASQYGVQAVHRMKLSQVVDVMRSSDALISGGGSLLQDVTGWKTIPYYLAVIVLAQMLGKPVFIYAQGIGPVTRRIFYPIMRRVLRKSAYISVRDDQSRQFLEEIGIARQRIELVADPVLALPLFEHNRSAVNHDEQFQQLQEIGISVRFWNQDRSELDKLAEALELVLQQRDIKLRFLPFHLPEDEEASYYIINKLSPRARGQSRVEPHGSHPRNMFAAVGSCAVLIGMRLHSLIYAAAQYVPVVGISYDPKIDEFLRQIHMVPAASTAHIEAQRVAEAVLYTMDHRQQWKSERTELIQNLMKNAVVPAQQIADYFRNKG